MSDHIEETPMVARFYCPTCEPDADPMAQMLETMYCHLHYPVRSGVDDDAVRTEAYLSGSSEAGGKENQTFCDFIHRKKRPLT